MKRLFLSIPLSEDFLNFFEDYQKAYEVQGLRWLSSDNLHVTVYFLGNIDDAQIDVVHQTLQKVVSEFHPFSMRLENIILAPPQKRPRMIWALFEKDADYQKFVYKLQDALKHFVRLEKKQDTIAHVTLARFKNPYLSKKIALQKPVLKNPVLNVTHCELIESQLLKEGPKYTVLKTYPL